MACQKDSMDNKYIGLISSNAQTNNELSKNIFELEKKLHRSEKFNTLLRKENEELKYNNNCGLHVQELEEKIVCNLNLNIFHVYIINNYHV